MNIIPYPLRPSLSRLPASVIMVWRGLFLFQQGSNRKHERPLNPMHTGKKQISEALGGETFRADDLSVDRTAGVLFLLQKQEHGPVLLLNKRSQFVKQAGDLCCPGGRLDQKFDRLLSLYYRSPWSALKKSAGWKHVSGNGSAWKRILAMYWVCCLRESWEEMGVRPWSVEFLGILPTYQLRVFRRGILPMVGWMRFNGRFRTNWEVEKIVPVPLADFLKPESYAGCFFRPRRRRG